MKGWRDTTALQMCTVRSSAGCIFRTRIATAFSVRTLICCTLPMATGVRRRRALRWFSAVIATRRRRRPGQFAQALTQKLMMYALGREISTYDMPQVRAIARAAAKDNYRFSSLVAGIVSSDAFRMQAQEE